MNINILIIIQKEIIIHKKNKMNKPKNEEKELKNSEKLIIKEKSNDNEII